MGRILHCRFSLPFQRDGWGGYATLHSITTILDFNHKEHEESITKGTKKYALFPLFIPLWASWLNC